MADARFEDGAERPLRLLARDVADLQVLAGLAQDAVLTGADLRWQPRLRRFALLLNRFRWEDQAAARVAGRPPERVRSLLLFADVTRVRHQGLDRRDGAMVLSLLTITYTPDAPPEDPDGPAGPGRVDLVFAGDGAVALTVECLDVSLTDVTRPYVAPSGRIPRHEI
jgi:hypothetical protein